MKEEQSPGRRLGEMLTRAESGITTQVDVQKVGRGAFNTKGDSWHNSVVQKFIQRTQLLTAVNPFAFYFRYNGDSVGRFRRCGYVRRWLQ